MNIENFSFNHRGELLNIKPQAWKEFINESLYTMQGRTTRAALLARDFRNPVWSLAHLALKQSQHVTSRQNSAAQKRYRSFRESLPPALKAEMRKQLNEGLLVNYESEEFQSEFDVADLIDQILIDVFVDGAKTRYLESDELKYHVSSALLPIFNNHSIHFTTTPTSPGHTLMREILDFVGLERVNVDDIAQGKILRIGYPCKTEQGV